MAISHIGSAAAAGNTATAPAHAVGDLMVVYAFRDGSTTGPTTAAGFTSITNTGANTCSANLAYKWCTSTSDATGTWTNATGVSVSIYRGVARVGANAATNGSSASISYPALTRLVTDGSSWIYRAAGHRIATNMTTSTPAGYTQRAGVATEIQCSDSNAGVGSNPAAGIQSVNASSGYRAVTLELLAIATTAVGSFVEEFGGNTIDAAKWTQAAASWTVQSGYAQVFAFGATSDQLTSINPVNVSGGELRWHAGVSLATTGSTVQIGFVGASGDSTLTGWQHTGVTGTNSTVQAKMRGVNVGASISSAAANDDRWWRVRESAGTTYFDYSTDGINWTNHTSTATPPELGRQHVVGFLAGNTSFQSYILQINGFNPTWPNLKVDTFSDAFDAADTAKWTSTTFGLYEGYTAGSVVFTPGDGNAGANYGYLTSYLNYDLTDSYGVIEHTTITPSGTTGTLTSIFTVGYAYIQKIGANLLFRELNPSTSTYDDTSVAYNATTMRWWRIRMTSGTLYWETAPDGVTWTVRKSKGTPTNTYTDSSVTLGTYWQGGTESSPGTFTVTGFNILAIGGTLGAAFQKMTAAATGTWTSPNADGTLGAAFQRPTAALSGSQAQSGSVAASMLKPLAALTGTQAQSGSVAAAFQRPTAALTGAQAQSGTMAMTTQRLLAALTGFMRPEGAFASTFQRPVAALAGTKLDLVEFLTENFATLDEGVKWYYDVAATVSSGQLVLTPNNAYTGSIYSVQTYVLTGSSFTVELVQPPNIGNGQVYTWMKLGVAGTGRNEFALIWANDDLVFQEWVSSVSTETSIDYDPVAHRYLRIRESGGTVFWETSPNGYAWTTQRSKTPGLSTAAVQPQILSGYDGVTTPGTAIWDNVNIPPPPSAVFTAALQRLLAAMTGDQSGAEATLAAAFQTVRAALTAAQAQTGTLGAVAQYPVASLTGVMHPTGEIAATMALMTAALTASQAQTATLAAALQRPLAAITGQIPTQGAIAAVLQLLQSGIDATMVSDLLSARLQRPRAAVEGYMEPSGFVASSMLPAQAALTAEQVFLGDLSSTFVAPRSSLTGLLAQQGILGPQITPVTAELTGAQLFSGSVGAALTPARAGLIGTQVITGTLGATLRRPVAFISTFQGFVGYFETQMQAPLAAVVGVEHARGVLGATLRPVIVSFAGVFIPLVISYPEPPSEQTPPLSPLLLGEQIISLHTLTGVQLYQFVPDDQISTVWSREQREVGRCELDLTSLIDADRLPDVYPWLHWITVWDGREETVLWTGPIMKMSADREGTTISARDHSAYLERTRNPLTKRWDAQDPCVPAGELWERMIDIHNLRVAPIVRPDPDGERFDHTSVADSETLNTTFEAFGELGLTWTVVNGIPIIGPMPKTPIATLGEEHFLGESPKLVRDGSATFNDLYVRGPNFSQRAFTPLHGLDLQTIHDVDSMFGVSNVARAANAYAKYASQIRDSIVMPEGAVLHPDAPVGLEQLIPSTRFVIDTYGRRTLQELTKVEVVGDDGGLNVRVTMDSVNDDLPELLENKPGDLNQAGGVIR